MVAFSVMNAQITVRPTRPGLAEFAGSDAATRIEVAANVSLAEDVTAWLPPALLVAMAEHRPLRIDGPVDAFALSQSAQAQQTLSAWFRKLATVEVTTASGAAAQQPRAEGVGCFFSGGVDSFYSAIENPDITHLIFVHGFDIPLADEDLGNRALVAARKAAEALGKQLIEVHTDVRLLADRTGLFWGTHFHGAALAMVGHLVSRHVGRVIVPATYTRDDLHPWGSHPDLDPLWSSQSVVFEHHGIDATRPQKIAVIARNAAALDHLRVCWKNPGGAYNCGRCEKCLRTMINLRSVGALDRCRTLPHEIEASAVASLRGTSGAALFARENLHAISKSATRDPDLEAALRKVIRTAPAWEAARKVRRALRIA